MGKIRILDKHPGSVTLRCGEDSLLNYVYCTFGEDSQLLYMLREKSHLCFLFCWFAEDGYLILVCTFGKDGHHGFGMFGEDGHLSFYG